MADLPEQIVTQADDLSACCEQLASSRCFGFDTEFVGEDSYHPHLCLVQVATSEGLFLIDPLTAGPLDAFWKLVVDPANLVVVHAGREEVRLCHLWTGRTPGNLFDLQIAAGLVGLTYPLGHAALVGQLMKTTLSKAETLTEWRERPLTRQQIRYAFDDVRFLLPLWRRLSERLEQRTRQDWAREEFARMVTNVTAEEPALEKWQKLRGLGSLDRRGLAVVRALYHWREKQAARSNRPARVIARDDLLVEISRRQPREERDLQVIRGLPHRDLRILEVVQQARALPLEDCPHLAERDQDPPQVSMAVSILQAVLADLSARMKLAPNLVANNSEIKQLVRSHLQKAAMPTGSLLTQGWRASHILPELLAVLEGRRGLRIADLRAETPLGYFDGASP